MAGLLCLLTVKENEYTAHFATTRSVFPLCTTGCVRSGDRRYQTAPDVELEKDCIRAYFSNLHLVYCFLDQKSFYERCKKEIWEPRILGVNQFANAKPSRFPSVYCAVLAIGALTAGDDTSAVQDEDRVEAFLDAQISQPMRRSGQAGVARPSFELAHFFYACSKAVVGDMFESSSLETSQALLLMVREKASPSRDRGHLISAISVCLQSLFVETTCCIHLQRHVNSYIVCDGQHKHKRPVLQYTRSHQNLVVDIIRFCLCTDKLTLTGAHTIMKCDKS